MEMIRILDYNINAADAGHTIQQYLETKGYSHPILVHLKKSPNSVLKNGKWEYLSSVLAKGDHLRIVLSENCDGTISPADIPLNICYEDEDILVINKPADMPIHPSRRNQETTLANAVCGYYASLGIPFTFRCVNRLDKDTTGLVIVAKHMLAAAILNEAITKREIHREYLALVYGHPPKTGTIDAPIARIYAGGIKREVSAIGEHAITHYETRQEFAGYSLISLQLETGRTHQIRVHMSHIGHPLLGDALYTQEISGISQDTDFCRQKIKRQALHSYRLQFTHPITGIPMDLVAPLPRDMATLLS